LLDTGDQCLGYYLHGVPIGTRTGTLTANW